MQYVCIIFLVTKTESNYVTTMAKSFKLTHSCMTPVRFPYSATCTLDMCERSTINVKKGGGGVEENKIYLYKPI
jgi:hypothetical protein